MTRRLSDWGDAEARLRAQFKREELAAEVERGEHRDDDERDEEDDDET